MIKLSAEDWNELYPVGTEVIFELVCGRPETRERRKTRSPAWDTHNASGVLVKLEGRAGGCAIDHMTPISIPPREAPQPCIVSVQRVGDAIEARAAVGVQSFVLRRTHISDDEAIYGANFMARMFALAIKNAGVSRVELHEMPEEPPEQR